MNNDITSNTTILHGAVDAVAAALVAAVVLGTLLGGVGILAVGAAKLLGLPLLTTALAAVAITLAVAVAIPLTAVVGQALDDRRARRRAMEPVTPTCPSGVDLLREWEEHAQAERRHARRQRWAWACFAAAAVAAAATPLGAAVFTLLGTAILGGVAKAHAALAQRRRALEVATWRERDAVLWDEARASIRGEWRLPAALPPTDREGPCHLPPLLGEVTAGEEVAEEEVVEEVEVRGHLRK